MKKITILLLIISLAYFSIGQQTTPTKQTVNTDYLKKSKTQKTIALIMAGTATALVLTGLIIPRGELIHESFFDRTYENSNLKGTLAASGVILGSGSVPLFVASSRNKRKAMSLSIKNEKTPSLSGRDIIYHSLPSLTIKLNL